MSDELVEILKAFAFLCAFAAVFIGRHRLAQQYYAYSMREWKGKARDIRDIQARFTGVLAIFAMAAMLIVIAETIYHHGK